MPAGKPVTRSIAAWTQLRETRRPGWEKDAGGTSVAEEPYPVVAAGSADDVLHEYGCCPVGSGSKQSTLHTTSTLAGPHYRLWRDNAITDLELLVCRQRETDLSLQPARCSV